MVICPVNYSLECISMSGQQTDSPELFEPVPSHRWAAISLIKGRHSEQLQALINWSTWQPKTPPGINPLRLIYLYVCRCTHTHSHLYVRVWKCEWIYLKLLLPEANYLFSFPRTLITNNMPTWAHTPDSLQIITPFVLCRPPDAGGTASNRGAARLAAGRIPSEPSVPAEEEV